MRILLVNDDGYQSYGITRLAEVLSEKHDVTVIAPHLDRSCMSHSATFFKPMLCKQIFDFKWECFSLEGTPVDCVILGLAEFSKEQKFDLMIAGINDVPNLGNDIIFSGTVQQVIEGANWKTPSIALSGNLSETEQIDQVAAWVNDNLDYLYTLSKISSISINFPKHIREDWAYKVCSLGVQTYSDHHLMRTIDEGVTEYILVGEVLKNTHNAEDCDIEMYKQGYVTISPVSLILNDEKALTTIRKQSR